MYVLYAAAEENIKEFEATVDANKPVCLCLCNEDFWSSRSSSRDSRDIVAFLLEGDRGMKQVLCMRGGPYDDEFVCFSIFILFPVSFISQIK